MSLPVIPLPSDTVRVGDADVPVRGLSFSEALRVQSAVEAGDAAEANVLMLAAGTDTPEADVRTWLDSVPASAIQPLFDAIQRLSGLSEGAQFRG